MGETAGRLLYHQLEIRYGALKSLEPVSQASFYFHDSGSSRTIAAVTGEHSPEIDANIRLTRLKDEVRNRGLKVHGYRNPAQLGELVFRSFQELIRQGLSVRGNG